MHRNRKEISRRSHSWPPAELVSAAVEANVIWSMRQLIAIPEAREAMRDKSAALVGAVYDLDSGKVRFIKNATELADPKIR